MDTAAFEALHARVAAKREAAGTNVHFINERGQRDRYSFATPERAELFRASLRKADREILEGPTA